MQKKISFKWLTGLLLVFLVYSCANIFIKFASATGGMIMLLHLGCAFGILGIYAYLWQQVLKRIPLTTAFMFKSSTVIYGMFLANILFMEEITTNNMIGASLIITGIIVLGWKS